MWRSALILDPLQEHFDGDLPHLFERLANRGHPQAEYARALKELRGRGYLSGSNEAPRLLDAGRVFREQVEQETDRMFYAPWECLDVADRQQMAALLEQLLAGLAGRAS